MTSVVAFPSRFTKIDGLTSPDHRGFAEDDRCFFLGEYTVRQGYAYSPTNKLILNFKKTPDRRGRPEWRHKEKAIQQAAKAFRGALGASPPSWTFVPSKGHLPDESHRARTLIPVCPSVTIR